MNLFGSKELLFCTSFRFLCGIIALKMNWWYDRKSLLRCHSNTSLYSHLLGQTVIRLRHVQTVCWRLCKQLHDSITNMTMTANELMTSCHSQMCVFSEWKILYYLKRVFLNIPHTNSLLFTLISNVCQIHMVLSVLYFVILMYQIIFYIFFTLDSMGKNNLKEQQH